MDKKRITIIAVTGAFVLAVVVLASLYFSASRRSTPEVVLPPEVESAGQDSETEPGGAEANNFAVTVTAENVQSVISHMSRPENYYMSLTSETFHAGGSFVAQGSIWVSGGMSRVRVSKPDGSIKNVIITSESTYVWYDGSDEVEQFPAGEISADDELLLYTYESVLDRPADEVTDAGYSAVDGVNCVYAEVGSVRVWISSADGLPVKVELLEQGKTVALSQRGETVVSGAGAEPFTLPDGTVVQES